MVFMDKPIIKKEKNLVNAIYRLTLGEQRLFHYAIAKINPFKHHFGEIYKIAVVKVVNFYSINASDAYKYMYDALDRLFERSITYYDELQEMYVTCRLIHKKYDNKKGIIGFVFGDEISEMVSSARNFLSYRLYHTINLTNVHANRIYEIILYNLQRSPTSKITKIFEVSNLKEILGLVNKYKRFAEFRKYVIEVALIQINNHTDIQLCFDIRKTGSIPTHIKLIAQYTKVSKLKRKWMLYKEKIKILHN